MTAGHFCNREVVVTGKESSIVEVARLMRHHHVGDVVVVAEEEGMTVPLGIITDRDIVMELIADQVVLEAVTVGDVMSYELIAANERDGIWDTLRRMRTDGIRRIPVVNDQGGLEGILTLDDMLELLTEELSLLAKVPSRAQDKERKVRT